MEKREYKERVNKSEQIQKHHIQQKHNPVKKDIRLISDEDKKKIHYTLFGDTEEMEKELHQGLKQRVNFNLFSSSMDSSVEIADIMDESKLTKNEQEEENDEQEEEEDKENI
eukprot:gene6569-10732_t